jgi:hypothetical protein
MKKSFILPVKTCLCVVTAAKARGVHHPCLAATTAYQ